MKLLKVREVLHGNTKVLSIGNVMWRISSQDSMMTRRPNNASRTNHTECQEFSSVASCISMWHGFSGSPVVAVREGVAKVILMGK